MPAQILDGKSLAAELRAAVKQRVAALAQRGMRPGVAVIVVGDYPASRVYVRNKTRACDETGLYSRQVDLPASVSETALLAEIARLNADPRIHGILVQLPLPPHLDVTRVQGAVSPAKDVDGFHVENLG